MSEFDLPHFGPQTQMESDEEMARKLAREDYQSDSDADTIQIEGMRLDEMHKKKEQERDQERQNKEQERKLEYENKDRERENKHQRERDQDRQDRDYMKRQYDNVRSDRDYLRRAYDNDKESRLRTIGLSLLPSYTSYEKSRMTDKINELIKRELKKESLNQPEKTDVELIGLVKSLIKKTAPQRNPRKKSKKKSVKKSKKKSVKKPKKTSVKKPKKTSVKKKN
jgi:hypothetical protein